SCFPLYFFCYCSPPLRELHSFPTRRSSDLGFFQEPLDTSLLVDDDDAELERVGYPLEGDGDLGAALAVEADHVGEVDVGKRVTGDRKSTRLNSSHVSISYAVFCSKKKKMND